MPTTLRALERRIGMDFSDVVTIYPLGREETCGKRYTLEELATLRLKDPHCTRHVAEAQCPGILYVETRLTDGTRKRTSTRSFPYNYLPRALGRLLSRVGMVEFMQHWRRKCDELVDGD
ncbi:hypothetical protein FRC10_009713, partial [Ceratobasidium sp. 414]